MMKLKNLFIVTAAGCALAFTLLNPDPTHGATDTEGTAKVAVLIQELQTQQKTVAANQAAIEQKIALIAEEIRIARIYVSRGGKGVTP